MKASFTKTAFWCLRISTSSDRFVPALQVHVGREAGAGSPWQAWGRGAPRQEDDQGEEGGRGVHREGGPGQDTWHLSSRWFALMKDELGILEDEFDDLKDVFKVYMMNLNTRYSTFRCWDVWCWWRRNSQLDGGSTPPQMSRIQRFRRKFCKFYLMSTFISL